MRTCVRMTTYAFDLITYSETEPWIVVSKERRTVELDDAQDFQTWARRAWPDDRYRVLVASDPLSRWYY